jgi:hypothetical protein
LLEAAVDHAVEHSERPVVGDHRAASRLVSDATGIRRDDASGFEHGNDAASGRLELDDASPTPVGQQSAEIVWPRRVLCSAPCGPPIFPRAHAANIGGVHEVEQEFSR